MKVNVIAVLKLVGHLPECNQACVFLVVLFIRWDNITS